MDLSKLGVPIDGTGILRPYSEIYKRKESTPLNSVSFDVIERLVCDRDVIDRCVNHWPLIDPSTYAELIKFEGYYFCFADVVELVRLYDRGFMGFQNATSWHNLAAKLVAPCLQPAPLDVLSSYRQTRYTEQQHEQHRPSSYLLPSERR